MRAIVSSGKSKRVVDLPTWVEVLGYSRMVAGGVEVSRTEPYAICRRCGRTLTFAGPKQEDERALGRFATWHRRCPDPQLIAAALKQAPIDRAASKARDEWFARRRAGK